MKLLVFASTPPPLHGQSYMVQQLLQGLGGDQRRSPSQTPVRCYHVNPRLSDDFGEIGHFSFRKLFRLARAILDAIWCRFRYGADVLYCIPAISLKGSILRDVLLLPILRPFFKRTVLHWHATGLGEWVQSNPSLLSIGAKFALNKADLAIVTREFNLADARVFSPRRAIPVPYGIPDPCPDFDSTLAPRRRERQQAFAAPTREPIRVNLLFMALCTEDKGLLDAVETVHLLNNQSASTGLTFHLTVAGKFLNAHEESKFQNKVNALGLHEHVACAGFIDGDRKKQLLAQSDLFCFPTFYSGESFPVVLIEAMAFGLPIVTSRWRGLAEVFPPDYPGVVEIKRPDLVAKAVLEVLQLDLSAHFRRTFLAHYTIQQHVRQLTEAFLTIDPARRD